MQTERSGQSKNLYSDTNTWFRMWRPEDGATCK